MNEVAQALIGTPSALALVPCGSGNGLALHLHLPRSLAAALRLIAGEGARIEAVDTGVVNGLPFFNAMGFGLDADVSRRFNRLQSRGLPNYGRTALAVLRHLRTERVTLQVRNERETLQTILIAVSNSDQYGNHARIAPRARVDDGLLDLVAVRPVGWLRAAELAFRLFHGSLDRSPVVQRWRGSEFSLERSGPGIIHTDGETYSTGARLHIAVRPRSLLILIPERSRAVARTASADPSRCIVSPS